MSRFIITSGSDFRPFSYDELIKPVRASAEAHAAIADAYDQLSMETAALGNYISTEEGRGDDRARAMYDNYVQKLQNFQNSLWENGITAGTRRDMSAARSAYAQDITRLQKAIQDRQERSKEYWDARHKNPDLIMGFDPRNSGLDNYLDNSEYGRDWYSYSGNQFASEVGAEAKARAAELLDSYAGKSEIPGYLRYIQKQGFTNTQVNNAGVLAGNILSGQGSLEDADDPATALLASVLISRMQATGARLGENVSPDEFGRMFNYGLLGLSQGIGEFNEKLIDDKVYDQIQKRSLAKYQHDLSNPAPNDNGFNYAIDSVGSYVENPDFDKQNTLYGGAVHNYRTEGPIVANVNGQQRIISNEAEASQIFDEMGRDNIRQKFGIDPELSFNSRRKNKRVETTFVMPDGKEVQVRYVKMNNDQRRDFANDDFMDNSDGFKYEPIAVEQHVGGKWVTDPRLTRDFNRVFRPYQKQREELIAANKGNKDFDISRIALVGKAKKDFYDKAGIPAYVPEEYAEAVHNTLNKQGVVTPSTIADLNMPAAVEHYTNNMREYYSRGIALGGKNGISKSSSFAFYPVVEGGIGYAKIGETNPSIVFGTKGTGKNEAPDYNGVQSFSVTPEDVYDYNKVRVTMGTGKSYGVDPAYLGNAVANLMDNMRMPIAEDQKGIVHYLMLPISDPARVSVMSNEQEREWYNTARQYLGRYMSFAVKNGDEAYAIGPKWILTDDSLQNILRNAVGQMLNAAFSQPRDWALLNPMQTVSTSSTKAQPYIGR